MVPQIASVYGREPREEATASQIAATNVAMREWRKEYMEYWNSTKDFSGTGRPVDAFIAPVAPFPASRPERYRAYGMPGAASTASQPPETMETTLTDEITSRLLGLR